MKAKRNKKYTPRPASPFAGLVAIQRNQLASQERRPMTDERQTNVLIAYHRALEAMTTGIADNYHFDTLVYALDIGVVLAEQGFGAEHADLLRTAIDGMVRTKERFIKTGRMGLDGDALAAVRAAYALHEAQLKIATLGELQAALDEMHRRIGAYKTLEAA